MNSRLLGKRVLAVHVVRAAEVRHRQEHLAPYDRVIFSFAENPPHRLGPEARAWHLSWRERQWDPWLPVPDRFMGMERLDRLIGKRIVNLRWTSKPIPGVTDARVLTLFGDAEQEEPACVVVDGSRFLTSIGHPLATFGPMICDLAMLTLPPAAVRVAGGCTLHDDCLDDLALARACAETQR